MRKSIVINHPLSSEPVTLDELRADVSAARAKGLSGQFAFTPETVEALLDALEAAHASSDFCVHGTETGRISSKGLSQSNTPKH